MINKQSYTSTDVVFFCWSNRNSANSDIQLSSWDFFQITWAFSVCEETINYRL